MPPFCMRIPFAPWPHQRMVLSAFWIMDKFVIMVLFCISLVTNDVGHLFMCLFAIVVVHCSVTKSCLTLCDPMNCSTPGFSFLHYLMEFAQTHVSWVSDAIQRLLPLSPLGLSVSQHQGLFSESAFRMRWPKYWSFSISISICHWCTLLKYLLKLLPIFIGNVYFLSNWVVRFYYSGCKSFKHILEKLFSCLWHIF